MRQVRRGYLFVALIAALTTTAPADAVSWKAGNRKPAAVALAGSHVEWLAPLRDGSTGLFDARVGVRPRRIQSFQRDRGYLHFYVGDFAGSRSTIVFQRTDSFVDPTGAGPYGVEYFVGGVGQRLTSLLRCDSAPGITGADVFGSVVVFKRCDGKLEIRDVATADNPEVVGIETQQPAIAGRYVAWLEGPYRYMTSEADIVVYDRRARVERYRIPASSIPARVTGLDVQPDGKIAFAFYASANDVGKGEFLAWASPARPSVHRFGLPRRFGYAFRLARDRLVFARFPKPRRTPGFEVGISDLHGQSRLYTREGTLAIDYDGTDVAYIRQGCHGYAVVRMPRSWNPRTKPPRACLEP